MAGHDDADDLRIDPMGRFQEFDAVHLRHREVGEHELEARLPQSVESLGRGCERRGRVAFDLQRAGERLHLRGVVIHDQQACARLYEHAHVLRSSCPSAVSSANACSRSGSFGGLLRS
jgi:hypothetical protein